MDEQDHGYALTGDALSQAAIAAANRSHMPYSKSPSGVALECKDGRIFSGSYAENAAFNPTLPPLQGALILLNLKGYDYPDIQRAVLAEKADAPLIQWDATSATLKALRAVTVSTECFSLKPGAGCGGTPCPACQPSPGVENPGKQFAVSCAKPAGKVA